jgi:GNAT superfamily N-acetyltransferase
LNSCINKTSQCYEGYYENTPVCFFAVLHFPHPKCKNIKRGHRLVVLPDYQGLGIGHMFSSTIAELYKEYGNRFIITSSTRSLYMQRSKDPRWVVTNKSRKQESSGILKNTTSKNRITYSYEFIG